MTNDRGETKMMTMLNAKLKNQAECNEFMKLGASLLEDGYFSKRTWADPPPLITSVYETLKKLKYRMWKDDTELKKLLMNVSVLSIVTPFNYLHKPELIQIDFLKAAANANIDKHPRDKKAMGPKTWKPSTKSGGFVIVDCGERREKTGGYTSSKPNPKERTLRPRWW
jgi:hypothetical protein